MNESSHAAQQGFLFCFVWFCGTSYIPAYLWHISQSSHVSHMNESCLTYEWVMSHIWMSLVIRYITEEGDRVWFIFYFYTLYTFRHAPDIQPSRVASHIQMGLAAPYSTKGRDFFYERRRFFFIYLFFWIFCIRMSLCARHFTKGGHRVGFIYSRLQIGWHRISRFFLKLFQRTRILPMGFTISTK